MIDSWQSLLLLGIVVLASWFAARNFVRRRTMRICDDPDAALIAQMTNSGMDLAKPHE